MRIKIIDNNDGTWSFYNQTEKRFIIKNVTEKECRDLKIEIDKMRRSSNALHRIWQ